MAAVSKMQANIEIISKELIKPSSPTPHERKALQPSLIDQLSPPSFIPLIFFYQNRSCSEIVDPSKRSQHLKQSLSESLTKFYPLAGKINGDFSVDCNDSGALFVEAQVHVSLSEAIPNSPFEKLAQYLPFEPFDTCNDKIIDTNYPRNDVLLAVQISWFECGSNAIGVCISHKVADAMSLVTFMNSWAATSRNNDQSADHPVLVLEPNFDLGRQLFPPLDFLPPSFSPPVVKGKITSKRLLFDKEKLAQLKQLATSSSGTDLGSPAVKDPTRVELVTAFLWKHFIMAAGAKNRVTTATSTWIHAVNLRNRMSSLRSNDKFPFGNLFTLTKSASPSMSDEDQEEEKEYQDLVWHTSNAIRQINEDHMMKTAPILRSLSSAEMEQMTALLMNADWCFTSWCRFPMYEVDFGWGKPISICPAGTPINTGILLTNTRCGEGIEAWIAMMEDEMSMLSHEFLSLQNDNIFTSSTQ